jgi:hypothetical protein
MFNSGSQDPNLIVNHIFNFILKPWSRFESLIHTTLAVLLVDSGIATYTINLGYTDGDDNNSFNQSIDELPFRGLGGSRDEPASFALVR